MLPSWPNYAFSFAEMIFLSIKDTCHLKKIENLPPFFKIANVLAL
jgi:hypothetical protein